MERSTTRDKLDLPDHRPGQPARLVFALLLTAIAGFVASQAAIVAWLLAGVTLAVISVIGLEWLFRQSIEGSDEHVPGGFGSY